MNEFRKLSQEKRAKKQTRIATRGQSQLSIVCDTRYRLCVSLQRHNNASLQCKNKVQYAKEKSLPSLIVAFESFRRQGFHTGFEMHLVQFHTLWETIVQPGGGLPHRDTFALRCPITFRGRFCSTQSAALELKPLRLVSHQERGRDESAMGGSACTKEADQPTG